MRWQQHIHEDRKEKWKGHVVLDQNEVDRRCKLAQMLFVPSKVTCKVERTMGER